MLIVKIISYPFKLVALFFIKLYKWCISPLLPHTCRFVPSCSTYAFKAIQQFGIFKGLVLAFKRLSKCTYRHAGGKDLLPQNIKGDSKWII